MSEYPPQNQGPQRPLVEYWAARRNLSGDISAYLGHEVLLGEVKELLGGVAVNLVNQGSQRSEGLTNPDVVNSDASYSWRDAARAHYGEGEFEEAPAGQDIFGNFTNARGDVIKFISTNAQTRRAPKRPIGSVAGDGYPDVSQHVKPRYSGWRLRATPDGRKQTEEIRAEVQRVLSEVGERISDKQMVLDAARYAKNWKAQQDRWMEDVQHAELAAAEAKKKKTEAAKKASGVSTKSDARLAS